MAPTRVILMSCGSYNPPTDMHLRMFELARDHLHRMGTHIVVGAVISPTHDFYAKKELVCASHRNAMLKLATQNSNWIRVSTWETRQNSWTKTRISLQHHQNLLNSLLLAPNDVRRHIDNEDTDWIPEKIRESGDMEPIQIKLLCGADLLESFGTPGLWAEEDIDAILGEHGLVVITREGSNPHKFIYDSDILTKNMHNIHIVTNWIRHEVSSTKIRTAFRRGDSVKYEVQDSVIDYVHKHGLYGAKTDSTIKLELSSKNGNDYLSIQPAYQSAFLTPSPSDIAMTTPSPVEIISIDFTDSVLKKNIQNSPSQQSSKFENELREKFIDVISENGNNNKLLASTKAAYPGQAKQIIATETGESQIFCEVGLSCISEKFKPETVDGPGEREVPEAIVLDIPCKLDCSVEFVKDKEKLVVSNEASPSEPLKSSDQTISPDDSESRLSVILALDTGSRSEIATVASKSPSVDKEVDLKGSDNGLQASELNKRADKEETAQPSTSEVKEDLQEFPKEDAKESKHKENIQQEKELTESPKRLEIKTKQIDSASGASAKDASTSQQENVPKEEDHHSSSESTEIPLPTSENKEIDGKYVKSVVNSRKSPKKVRTTEEDIAESGSSSTLGSAEAQIPQSEENPDQDNSLAELQNDPKTTSAKPKSSSLKSGSRRRGVLFQGSLDSINVGQPKSCSTTSSQEPMSKKSKSYEFIKQTEAQPTTIYRIPSADLKTDTDSTSVFVTANEGKDGQTGDICSVCYSVYTLRSGASSPLEEDSSECDICSNCELQENGVVDKDRVRLSGAAGEPVCELCEVCGDKIIYEDPVAPAIPEKDDFVERRVLTSRTLPLSLPKKKKGVSLNARAFHNVGTGEDKILEIENLEKKPREIGKASRSKSIDDPPSDNSNSNEDEFEIENCGLDLDMDFESNESEARYKSEVEDQLRSFVPRDEVAMSGKSANKMTRAGSLVSRDTVDRSRSKRRYSSVDNLQNSRQQVVKTVVDKQSSLKSRGESKALGASVDSIRPVRSSRSRSLRRSADDVGKSDESPLYENIQRTKSEGKTDQKPRDSGTIKMILTKHGIKIISDKETAL